MIAEALVLILGSVFVAEESDVPAQTKPGTRYETCSYPGQCLTIELRLDGTFSFTDRRDGVVWPALEGLWKAEGDGLIRASTLHQPTALPLRVESRPLLKALTFCVEDEKSKVAVPNALISFEADGIAATVSTDNTGCVKLPRYRGVSWLEVRHCECSKVAYTVDVPGANVFRVRLQRPRPCVTDQYWLVHNGKLLLLTEPPLKVVAPAPAATAP